MGATAMATQWILRNCEIQLAKSDGETCFKGVSLKALWCLSLGSCVVYTCRDLSITIGEMWLKNDSVFHHS